MKEKQLYRQALYETFASENYNQGQCDVFVANYDKLVSAGMSPEASCGLCYSAWGSGSPERVCRTIKDLIEKQIGDFASTHKGIDRNPVTRLRDYAKRLNEKIDQVCITVDGQELSKEEISRIKIRLPGCLNPPTTFQATASHKGKSAVFELDVSK